MSGEIKTATAAWECNKNGRAVLRVTGDFTQVPPQHIRVIVHGATEDQVKAALERERGDV